MFKSARRILRKKDKTGQFVNKIRPLVEYEAFFWDPWQRVYMPDVNDSIQSRKIHIQWL